jgi:hypothetical protein
MPSYGPSYKISLSEFFAEQRATTYMVQNITIKYVWDRLDLALRICGIIISWKSINYECYFITVVYNIAHQDKKPHFLEKVCEFLHADAGSLKIGLGRLGRYLQK